MINQQLKGVLKNIGFEYCKSDESQMILNVMLTAKVVDLSKLLHLSRDEIIAMTMSILQDSLNRHFDRMKKIELVQGEDIWQMQ